MAVIRWLQKVLEGKKKLSEERRAYKQIDDQLVFVESKPLSIGVEFELGLLDADTLLPAHKGPAIIAQIGSPQVKKELFEHMVEVTTQIAKDVHEAEAQLKSELAKVTAVCSQQNLRVTGTGRPATIKLADTRRVQDDRYKRLQDERQVFNERFGTLGMHMHIGMSSAEQCVRYHNFLMHFIPHLVALSASSPFEDGIETGLASVRPTVAESMPIAGMPYNFNNWQEYVNLCHAMYRAGSIQNLKDLWWDLRACPRYGTLEIRVCDQPASLGDGMATVAFVHALALWFQENQSWLDEMPRPNTWRSRENKWRAMRYGMKAQLVMNNQGDTKPICDDLRQWIERLAPFIKQCKYENYMKMLQQIMDRGNSADRQQRLWNVTHDLAAVACFNCDEFAAQTPLWDRVEEAEKTAQSTPPVKSLPVDTIKNHEEIKDTSVALIGVTALAG